MKTRRVPHFFYETDQDRFILYLRRDDNHALMYISDTRVPVDFSLRDREDLNTLASRCFDQVRQKGLKLPDKFSFVLTRLIKEGDDCRDCDYRIEEELGSK